MGACEPGQARDRAAISGNFHVPGFSLKAVFFASQRSDFSEYSLFSSLSSPFLAAVVLSCFSSIAYFFPSSSFAVFPIPPALSFSLKPFLFFEKFCRICEKIG